MPVETLAAGLLRLAGYLVGAGAIAWATLLIKGVLDSRKLRLEERTQGDRAGLDRQAQEHKAAAEARDDRREDFKATTDALKENIAMLTRQMELQQGMAKQTSEGLQTQINTQGAEIRRLQEQVESLRNERHELLSQIAALEMAKGAEKLRADQAERRVIELNEEICRLREEAVKRERLVKDLRAETRRVSDSKTADQKSVEAPP